MSIRERFDALTKRMDARNRDFQKVTDAYCEKRQAFWNDQERDRRELFRLQFKLHREVLKEHLRKDVVLNGNVSVEPQKLRNRRGELATLERVGRTLCDIVFTGFEIWTVPLEWVVPATPEAIAGSAGSGIDAVNGLGAPS